MKKDKYFNARIDSFTHELVTEYCKRFHLSFCDFLDMLIIKNREDIVPYIEEKFKTRNIDINEFLTLKEEEVFRGFQTYIRKQNTSKDLFFRRFLLDLQKYVFSGCDTTALENLKKHRLAEVKQYKDNDFQVRICEEICKLDYRDLNNLFTKTKNMCDLLLSSKFDENLVYQEIKHIQKRYGNNGSGVETNEQQQTNTN